MKVVTSGWKKVLLAFNNLGLLYFHRGECLAVIISGQPNHSVSGISIRIIRSEGKKKLVQGKTTFILKNFLTKIAKNA